MLLEFAVEYLRRNRRAYDAALKALPEIREFAAPPDEAEYVAPMV
jgi:hypothetical protein